MTSAKRTYLDHNATTPVRPEVRSAFLEAWSELGGNASSLHASGRRARGRVDEARERVAAALGVHEEEIVFTSGGTEANNLALLGALRPLTGAGLVTTAAEHSSVLAAAESLEREGHPVHRVGVDDAARPQLDELRERSGEPGCRLVSVVAANNEVGTIAPLAAIGETIRARAGERPLFHSDAVQALGRVPVDVARWGVDLASFSAHKLGGPPGCGFLYRARSVRLAPILHGGEQEAGLRPGTENVPAISACALAVELAVREQKDYAIRTRELSTELWREVLRTLPGARLLGPEIESEGRLPNTLNVLFPHVDGRVLIARLDLEGLEASAGSACASGSLEPSHVLLAMGLSSERARAGVRLSLGRDTTREDIHTAVERLRITLTDARKS